METLEIHSKAFLIKWVSAPADSTINWQVKPSKKSINFGLFMRTGELSTPMEKDEILEEPETSGNAASVGNRERSSSWKSRERSASMSSMSIDERMLRNGLSKVYWHGKCVADELIRGSYKVDRSGMYALVFDNTFSKTTGKTVLFSQRVERRGIGSATHLTSKRISTIPFNGAAAAIAAAAAAGEGNTSSAPGDGSENIVSDGRYIRGVMLKKRRKRLQGYARRYFSLDCKHGVFSYYLDQKSSFLRGSMPIPMCVVSVREPSKEIFIDSGMELWSLRALTDADFKVWVQSLKIVKQKCGIDILTGTTGTPSATTAAGAIGDDTAAAANDESEWSSISKLVDRLDELSKTIVPAANGSSSTNTSQVSLNDPFLSDAPPVPPIPSDLQAAAAAAAAATEVPSQPQHTLQRRPSFWRRKSIKRSTSSPRSSPKIGSTSPGLEGTANTSSPTANATLAVSSSSTAVSELKDIISQFRALISEHDLRMDMVLRERQNLSPVAQFQSAQASRRGSLDNQSVWSEDLFYDANDAFDGGVVFVNVNEDDSDVERNGPDIVSPIEEDDTLSSDEEDEIEKVIVSKHFARPSATIPHTVSDLYPLPYMNKIWRRLAVKENRTSPPSIISILRKNVGKDMSSIPMPVTLNEPITFLQRIAESMEYTFLLDQAAATPDPVERVLLMAVFAASTLAGFRAKERNLRKPFNPMLGESYELVREDRGFRMVCEKVSHRPVILTMYAESADWTVSYTSKPHQKFWGKSVEFTDPGRFEVTMNRTGEVFEYGNPSIFMRNLIAGEKYIEPVGSLGITSSNGTKAVVEYKAGGMFSGRSEQLTITAYDENGRESPRVLTGTWTAGIYEGSSSIWAPSNLIDNYDKRYGWNEWVVSLNEITEMEEGTMAPTDSRYREDQRMYEDGNIDGAEKRKQELEQLQRDRREQMQQQSVEWSPLYFDKVGELRYVPKQGRENYWVRRANNDWSGLINLWSR
ncbi:oxysterol-binding protein homolog 3 [Trichomonascus vanleenenianus]|uniref:oxysterol-binding protein related protein OSH3 n=1 Tax=Trichomonascus vanleenenianus TaxID=2268995 RepID=UPI003ECA735E